MMKPLKSDEINGNWTNIGTRLRWSYRSIPEERVGIFREKAQALLPEFFLITK